MALADVMLMALAGTSGAGGLEEEERTACREKGCASTALVQCAYVDGLGRACATRWCNRHSKLVGGSRYCRRHASTVTALGPKADDPRALPEVGHRGASLVSWVYDEGFSTLNPAVQASLRPGEMVFEDRSVNVVRGGDGSRRWERGWRIGDRRGGIRKLVLRVDESDDTTVSLVAGDVVLAKGVPPWISKRGLEASIPEEMDLADRQHFYAFLESFVRRALAGPV
ncbi:MAG TPA: hypothetical protein VEK76_00860 [Candidatus Binatia bacterium]|nr:hypothetical protein [Candidatus Binatia bacterium]